MTIVCCISNSKWSRRNLFDTQIAAGFVGYRYPLSFAKLVAKETKHRPGKGFTVSDWQSRPLTTKQIRYALEDVVPLHELYLKLSDRIESMGRTSWFRTELHKYEVPGLFEFNPYKEAFQNNLITNMSRKEQLFLLRIYRWRVDLARERDHSKEMVMPNKYISFVLKNIKAGKVALLGHRRLPPDIVKKHWTQFEALYESEATPEELEILTKLPPGVRSKAEENITIDLLINLLRFHCQAVKLAPELLLTGINTKRMRMDPSFFDDGLEKGWRAEVLGSGLIGAFKNQKKVDIDLNDERALISLS